MKIALTILIAGVAFAQQPPAAPPRPGMVLTSPSYEDGAVIPNKFTQNDPKPISPKLEWTNVPPGVVTFALLMHDPEGAPQKGSTDVTHWLAFNIPGSATSLPENVPATATLPDGTIQVKNTRGAIGFLGPGAGAQGPYHHYTMELFALDSKLDLGPDAARADVLKAMDAAWDQ